MELKDTNRNCIKTLKERTGLSKEMILLAALTALCSGGENSMLECLKKSADDWMLQNKHLPSEFLIE